MPRNGAAALCLAACLLAAAAAGARAATERRAVKPLPQCPTFEGFLRTQLGRDKYGWILDRLHMLPRHGGFTLLLPVTPQISGELPATSAGPAQAHALQRAPPTTWSTRLGQPGPTPRGAQQQALPSPSSAGSMLRKSPPVLSKTLDRLLQEITLTRPFSSVRGLGGAGLRGAGSGEGPRGFLPRMPAWRRALGHAAPPAAHSPRLPPPCPTLPAPCRAGRGDGARRLRAHAVRQARGVQRGLRQPPGGAV